MAYTLKQRVRSFIKPGWHVTVPTPDAQLLATQARVAEGLTQTIHNLEAQLDDALRNLTKMEQRHGRTAADYSALERKLERRAVENARLVKSINAQPGYLAALKLAVAQYSSVVQTLVQVAPWKDAAEKPVVVAHRRRIKRLRAVIKGAA